MTRRNPTRKVDKETPTRRKRKKRKIKRRKKMLKKLPTPLNQKQHLIYSLLKSKMFIHRLKPIKSLDVLELGLSPRNINSLITSSKGMVQIKSNSIRYRESKLKSLKLKRH